MLARIKQDIEYFLVQILDISNSCKCTLGQQKRSVLQFASYQAVVKGRSVLVAMFYRLCGHKMFTLLGAVLHVNDFMLS